jgi:hypothetical protein
VVDLTSWSILIEWVSGMEETATKLHGVNAMLAVAFNSVAEFLEKKEQDKEDWHLAPIWGHSLTHKLFPLYPTDISTLQVCTPSNYSLLNLWVSLEWRHRQKCFCNPDD